MKLTIEWLEDRNCNDESIDFYIRNKLIGMDLDDIKRIRGDFDDQIGLLTRMKNNTYHFNEFQNITYIWNCSESSKEWIIYDENQNPIHHKIRSARNRRVLWNSDEWMTYDENNNLIHTKRITNDELDYDRDIEPESKPEDVPVKIKEYPTEEKMFDDKVTSYYEYDQAMNRISTVVHFDGYGDMSSKIESDFYCDGQLRQLGDISYIPKIRRGTE